ncbi:hypothetical protein NL676_017685 [Syzygium grande]|nr:hypothetical protein NL676_017685 [Syzygium grande]
MAEHVNSCSALPLLKPPSAPNVATQAKQDKPVKEFPSNVSNDKAGPFQANSRPIFPVQVGKQNNPPSSIDVMGNCSKHHFGDISRKSANLPSHPTRLDPPHLSHHMEKLDDQIPIPDISPASSQSSSEKDDSQDDKASNISSDSEEGPTVMLTKRSRVKSHSMAETSKPDIVPAPRNPSLIPKIIPAKGSAPSETILANPKARNRETRRGLAVRGFKRPRATVVCCLCCYVDNVCVLTLNRPGLDLSVDTRQVLDNSRLCSTRPRSGGRQSVGLERGVWEVKVGLSGLRVQIRVSPARLVRVRGAQAGAACS